MKSIWPLIPLAPLIALVFLWRWPARSIPWLWLTCVPALAAALWPAESLLVPIMWPGVEWGVADPVGRGFLGLTALLWGAATLFAVASQDNDPHRLRFWLFWLLSLSGNLLLVIAADGGSFYVGFTVMSLAAYGLVIHRGGPEPRRAGRLYLQLAVFGEMLLFAALMLRTSTAADSGFAIWRTVPVDAVTAALLLLGFGIKAGFWPLHVWLPRAHPVAPAAASAVLSGAMIKAGILGLWRFMPDNSEVLVFWAPVLMILGAISAFYGVLMGLIQQRIKVALAYSSISQIGYLLAILALAWSQPELRGLWGGLLALYAVHHGLVKGALFLGAGMISSGRLTGWQWGLMALPGLALAGSPLTSGAAVKALFKEHLAASDFYLYSPMLSAGALATALLVFRAYWLMAQHRKMEGQTVPAGYWLPWGLVCLAPLVLPWIWPSMNEALLAGMTLSGAWNLLWPLLMAAALGLAALGLGMKVPGFLLKMPETGVIFSLQLKKLVQRPPLPQFMPKFTVRQLRQIERRWNHFCREGGLLTSIWLLCLILILGWLF